MNKTLKVSIIGVLLLGFSLQVQAITIFNKSPIAVQYGFDLMETFDDIQDWQGPTVNGKARFGISSVNYPKRVDGSDTPFNTYDYWANSAPGDDFIKDHRVNGGKIFDPNNTGTGKSLCMDISHRGTNGLGNGKNWGPSRFGTYFGSTDGINGDYTHGYNEMHVFFMMYVHPNQWPTHVDASGEGSYVEGDFYNTNNNGASWKFITMAHGFKEPWTHWQGIGSGHVPEYDKAKGAYGWHPNVVHMSPHGLGGEFSPLQLRYGDINDYLALQDDPDAPCENESRGGYNSGYTTQEIPTGEWVGVEIRYTMNTRGNDDASEQLWWYSADGTSHTMESWNNLWFQTTCEFDDGVKMNRVYIGGNNSNNYTWGDSMEPRYYIDDFVINDTRIGPSYFSQKLAGSTIRADVDQSGSVNSTDALLTLKNSLGLEMSSTNWQVSSTTGDVNCSSGTNSTDALLILRESLGLDMSGTGWCVG